jgi:hypothetical protein
MMTIDDGLYLLGVAVGYSFGACALLGLLRWSIQRMIYLFKKIIS